MCIYSDFNLDSGNWLGAEEKENEKQEPVKQETATVPQPKPDATVPKILSPK